MVTSYQLGARVKSKLRVPPNVRVLASTNGWITSPEYHHWLTAIFRKQATYCGQLSCTHHKGEYWHGERWLQCRAGHHSRWLYCYSTAHGQMYQSSFQEHWQEWMRQDRPKTPAGNLKQATRQDVIDWVSRACGISNALDGTQDDLVTSPMSRMKTSRMKMHRRFRGVSKVSGNPLPAEDSI